MFKVFFTWLSFMLKKNICNAVSFLLMLSTTKLRPGQLCLVTLVTLVISICVQRFLCVLITTLE